MAGPPHKCMFTDDMSFMKMIPLEVPAPSGLPPASSAFLASHLCHPQMLPLPGLQESVTVLMLSQAIVPTLNSEYPYPSKLSGRNARLPKIFLQPANSMILALVTALTSRRCSMPRP